MPLSDKETEGETKDKARQTKSYALEIAKLSVKARSVVRDLNPLDDLTFFRVKAQRQEILVAPDRNYFLIVIQELGS